MSEQRPSSGPEPGALTLAVRADRVVLVGIALWAVALVVVLLVPGLHEGGRAWWPWVCLAGLALGGLGWLYLRRGRGNAEEAREPMPVSVPPRAAERVEQVRARRSRD